MNTEQSSNTVNAKLRPRETVFLRLTAVWLFTSVAGVILMFITHGKFVPAFIVGYPTVSIAFVFYLVKFFLKDAAISAAGVVEELQAGRKSMQLAKLAETWQWGNTAGALIMYSFFEIPAHLAAFKQANLPLPPELATIVRQLDKQWWNFGWRIRKYVVLRRLSKAAQGNNGDTST